MPEISVVIPVYNTEKYLQKCLDSVCNQTFTDIEIICIDDGSTDNSLKILKENQSKDSRIKIIHREHASGSAACPRNIGLKMSNGKYITFFDSDDYFDLTMLEKMYFLAENKNADLVMCDNYLVDSYTERIRDDEGELHHKYLPLKQVFNYKDIPSHIFQISNATVWHKLILKDLIIDNYLKFQENVPILDDILFVNLLLVKAKRITVCDEKLVYYREARSGAQTTGIEKNVDSVFKAFYALNSELKKANIYEDVKVSLQNWTLMTLSWWLFSIMKYETAKELFYKYKNEYFEKLNLFGMVKNNIYMDLYDFYKYVLEEEYEPSIWVVLESLSDSRKKLIVYGAGKVGKKVYDYLEKTQKHDVVLWCDKNAIFLPDERIKSVEMIKEVEFDALIIAIGDKNIVSQVKDYLKNESINMEMVYSVC